MSVRTPLRSKFRRLKISYQFSDQHRDGQWVGSRTVPFLRLSGDWLQQAGFEVGQHVHVQVTAQRIVIVPATKTPIPNT